MSACASSTGVVGIFATMIAQGAFFGMGAVDASAVGLTFGPHAFFVWIAIIHLAIGRAAAVLSGGAALGRTRASR